MRKLTGAAFVSLDGVMQAPGGPTEDPTGRFDQGGWVFGIGDDVIDPVLGELFTPPYTLLLGRRTYDIFAAYWPYAEGDSKPMGELFDRIGKYVLTRSEAPLTWQNSHRLGSIEALAELKRGDGPDLVIQGSSTLYPQLLAAGLIDRLTVMTFRVVLGEGKRLFGRGTPARTMQLVEHKVTADGALIATYEPAGAVETGTFAPSDPSPAETERQARMREGRW
jgi:dihydrofolate reductase